MDERVLAAAQAAMKDMQAQAARKIANAQRQVVATVATQARIELLQGTILNGRGRRGDAQIAEMVNTGNDIEGMKSEAMSDLRELLHATSSREDVSAGRSALMFLFDAENPAMTRDLVREIFGNADGRTGNAVAQKAAKVWNETTEGLRQRFNAAGGDIGKLAYGYLSQAHDAIRVRAVTAQVWASKVMPLVDRARYVDDTGRQLNDAEVMAFLEKAHETIATEGLNKVEPGQITGSGARANRGGDARQVHFKDGDAYLEYMAEFGKGTAYDAMMGHIGMLTRDIGLVERYGPNPEAQFRLQTDISVRADGGTTRSFGNQQQAYWDILSGKTSSPASELMASVGTGIRNIQTAGKLAGAVLSSITDVGSMVVSTGFNKLSYWELFKNIKEQGSLTAAGKEAREFAITHGIIAESLAGGVNRWAGEVLSNGFTGRMANATMRLSLMNAWTDTMRNAFAMTMMNGMGNMAKKEWGALSEWDRAHMMRKGVSEADWAVINKAQLTMRDGRAYLTPEAIRDADIAVARPQDLQRIKDDISAQTAELTQRNVKDSEWIRGRMDKFDQARDALNRRVKERLANRESNNREKTGALLERMSLLDAQREAAKVQADIEADFNKLFTKADIQEFKAGLKEATGNVIRGSSDAQAALRSAIDTTEVSRSANAGMSSAQSIGRKYGEKKGQIERRMRELENKIAEMDRSAKSEANADGKAAQKKADEMLTELRDYIARSTERQARREAVIERLQREEDARLQAEAQRIKNEVVSRVLGLIKDESEFAVINPDMAARGVQTWGGLQAGTGAGEFARMVMQFKSFPATMISRHWRRMLDSGYRLEGAPIIANPWAYGGALGLSTVMLGAIAFQGKQLVAGKDPINMDPTEPTGRKFWTKAVAQGGGLSFMGDILLSDTTQDRSSLDTLSRMTMGPTFGSAADAFELTKGNIDEAMAGKDTQAGAESIRFARSHLPFVNLWYAKSALDHLFVHAMQENLSPGYLGRMQGKAQKDWGQEMWWAPGDALPERGPDFGAVMGDE